MDTLLLRNKLLLKVFVAVGFFVLQIHPTLTRNHIFDITRLVDGQAGDNPLNASLNSSTIGLGIQFYYKTDLSLFDFMAKKFATVNGFLDQQHNTNSHGGDLRRANLIVEFPVTDKDTVEKLPDFISIATVAERISVIVLSIDNVWYKKSLVSFVGNMTSLFNFSIPLGISYHGGRILVYKYNQIRDVLHLINVSIVSLSRNINNFIPSQEMLKSEWKMSAERNNRIIEGKRDELKIMYHIQLEASIGNISNVDKNDQDYQRYERFFSSTIAQLATEENEYFIIEPFTIETGELTVAGGTALNQADFIIPTLRFDMGHAKYIRDYLVSGRGVFTTLYVKENGFWNSLWLYKSDRMEENLVDKTKLNIMCQLGNEDFFESDAWKKTRFEQGFINLQALGITASESSSEYLTMKLRQWQRLDRNRTVFCEIFDAVVYEFEDKYGKIYLDDSGFTFNYTKVASSCKYIFNITNQFIWNVRIQISRVESSKIDFSIVASAVILKLELVDSARLQFIRENPGKEVIYKFDIDDTLGGVQSVYCNLTILAENSLFESIGNWGALRKVRVILKPLVGNMAWMSRASYPYSLNESPETVSLVVRNYPRSVSSWLGKLDACVEKTKDIPESGIILNKNFTGVTFNFASFRNTSFNVEIVKTMLHFVLHKFSRAIIPVGDEVESLINLKNAFVEVRQEFEENIGNYSKLTEVYIEVEFSVGKFPSAEYYGSVDDLVKVIKRDRNISFVGIYAIINNEENDDDEYQILSKIEANVKSANSIGIGFKNCIPVLNHILEESNPKSGEQLPLYVNYVICQTKKIQARNSESTTMAELLDGNLVIRNAFKRRFPHLTQVHFQLLPEKTGRNDMLNFYNDVAKYSELYEVSHFLGLAFDDLQNQGSGWWRIDNNKDLLNTLVYTDKEMEHLGMKTWKPDKEPVKNSKDPKGVSILLWAGLAGVIGILAVAFVIVYLLGKRSRVLTEKEAREFLQGKKITEERMELCSRYDVNAIGFKEEFGIPKVHNAIESCKILGMGNFGIVVKTTVRDETVALKIPNDGCSKESFKSMLTEVKLLCFIGEHVNVIKFVGAYVKEIRNGVIQIATVHCENGSLQSYLREKQTGWLNEGNGRNVIDSGLLRELIHFAKEIACGMAYIGTKNVVHGDLATRNVLLDGNNTCKIADFGLARKLYEYNKYVKQSQEPLPWRWMAFESLVKMEFTVKSDMWSYGVTLWEIFSLGEIPYPGLTWSVQFAEDIRNGLRMGSPQFSTPEIFAKMSNCWKLEPETRPTFEEMESIFIAMTNSDYSILHEVLDEGNGKAN